MPHDTSKIRRRLSVVLATLPRVPRDARPLRNVFNPGHGWLQEHLGTGWRAEANALGRRGPAKPNVSQVPRCHFSHCSTFSGATLHVLCLHPASHFSLPSQTFPLVLLSNLLNIFCLITEHLSIFLPLEPDSTLKTLSFPTVAPSFVRVSTALTPTPYGHMPLPSWSLLNALCPLSLSTLPSPGSLWYPTQYLDLLAP